jgi:hypothetical protein
MLVELAQTLLEDVVLEALKGLFRHGQTKRIRRLKTTAWLCLMTAGLLIVVGATWPQAMPIEVTITASLIFVLATLAFGFWASLEHARLNKPTAKMAA